MLKLWHKATSNMKVPPDNKIDGSSIVSRM